MSDSTTIAEIIHVWLAARGVADQAVFDQWLAAMALERLDKDAFIRNEQREAMLLTCSAEQRYQWLSPNEPALLAQLPQFHIASYIGVDAVSPSRLKRKLKPDSNNDQT